MLLFILAAPCSKAGTLLWCERIITFSWADQDSDDPLWHSGSSCVFFKKDHKKDILYQRHTHKLTAEMMLSSHLRPSLHHLLSLRFLSSAASRMVAVKPPKLLSESLAFEDPSAFRVKSLYELLRALGVFHFCSFPVLVNNCGKVRAKLYISVNTWQNVSKAGLQVSSSSLLVFQLMTVARTILGRRGLSFFLKPTVYSQFVAGENEREISQSMKKMSMLGMRPMLAVPIEEDLGESTGYGSVFCCNILS